MDMYTYDKAKKLVEDIEDIKSYIAIWNYMLSQDQIDPDSVEKLKGFIQIAEEELKTKMIDFMNL